MRIHTLEATGGVPYAQMPRFATADGKGTNDAAAALQANGRPVDNAARNIWVTETALTTALNTSYMAEQLALFGIVVGIALLLAGIGFGILAIGGALRNPETALTWFAKRKATRREGSAERLSSPRWNAKRRAAQAALRLLRPRAGPARSRSARARRGS